MLHFSNEIILMKYLELKKFKVLKPSLLDYITKGLIPVFAYKI